MAIVWYFCHFCFIVIYRSCNHLIVHIFCFIFFYSFGSVCQTALECIGTIVQFL